MSVSATFDSDKCLFIYLFEKCQTVSSSLAEASNERRETAEKSGSTMVEAECRLMLLGSSTVQRNVRTASQGWVRLNPFQSAF